MTLLVNIEDEFLNQQNVFSVPEISRKALAGTGFADPAPVKRGRHRPWKGRQ
jgi:hypothetical protein